jgi:hypothetical protein
MINPGKKEFKGIIAHFYTAGLMLPIGKHGLKIAAKLFNAGLLRVFFWVSIPLGKVMLVIIDVPPVTFTGTCT